MGLVGSRIYALGKRIAVRYNAEERVYKFLEKGKLPPAPRHEIKNYKEVPLSREALEDIHCKNIQLNEYLKKVYLTSTSKITGTPSTRPKPKKENELRRRYRIFFEPETPAPGCCTLTNVVQILLNFDPDSTEWSVDGVAEKFKLNKNDVVLLVTYYSLFRREKLDFLNEPQVKPEKIEKKELEEPTPVERTSLRKIDSK